MADCRPEACRPIPANALSNIERAKLIEGKRPTVPHHRWFCPLNSWA